MVELLAHPLGIERRHPFDLHRMVGIENECFVGPGHRSLILGQEVFVKARIRVEFHAGHHPAVGIQFLHGSYRGTYFGRRMGEILENDRPAVVVLAFQAVLSPFEIGQAQVKIEPADSGLFCGNA